MEQLSFKNLNAVYLLDTEFRKLKEEDYVSHYSCQWIVKAHYDDTSKSYEFCLDRKDVKINQKPVEKLMDKLVHEIGSSLYPMQLKVSEHMEITQIINYKEIVCRWKEISEKCRSEHPGEIMDRYIHYSGECFFTSKALLRSLYNDSFINMYFRNLYAIPEDKNERECIEWYNFPLREMKSSYFCTIEKPEENKRKLEGQLMTILPGQEGLAKVIFLYGSGGEPEEVAALFTTANDSKYYQKKIQICRLKEKSAKQDK